MARANELVAASVPFLRNNVVYYPMPSALSRYESEKASYDAPRVSVVLADDLLADSILSVLNGAVGYGLLRVLGPGERPTSRDVAILRHLPNSLPTGAGATAATFTPSADLAGYAVRAVVRYADGLSGPDEPDKHAASASTDAIQ